MTESYLTHEMFSRAADEFRSMVAIECMTRRVTYGQLEAESNRLANFLIDSGAEKGSIIAIGAEDSINMITAIIATLKTGCVFVPLVPDLPVKRLEEMVRQVSPEWLIVEPKFLGWASQIASACRLGLKVICPDSGAREEEPPGGLMCLSELASYSNTERPTIVSRPDDMCYIYFTSGSTGKPKAIAGRAKSLAHFIEWEIRLLAIGAGSRVSQLTTPAFDAYLRDVFVPLCSGGTVCVPGSRDISFNPKRLVDWLDIERVTLLHCVPSVFRSILNEALRPDYFSSLQYVLMAGEPLFACDVKRWIDVFNDRIQLVNLYGPTETTLTKLFYFVKPAEKDRRSIPIGKPMDGAAAIIIDAQGRPCSPGVVGEIYIRTPYRTLGYYGQPELTSEVFIQNPFSNDPNDLVYKTGDMGLMLEDGNFEYVGRQDRQVKIHGVRVELGEIEALLGQHPAIREVAVVAREDASENNVLCAYMVMKYEVDFTQLREYLGEHLPETMQPSAYLEMEKLPRLLNGKVDLQGLPTIEAWRSASAGYEAPRTEVEAVLAEIWRDVLGLKEVGIHDNFFKLGGHSLVILQIISRVQTTLELELPLALMFHVPTIARLAERIEIIRWAGRDADAGTRLVEDDREEIVL